MEVHGKPWEAKHGRYLTFVWERHPGCTFRYIIIGTQSVIVGFLTATGIIYSWHINQEDV